MKRLSILFAVIFITSTTVHSQNQSKLDKVIAQLKYQYITNIKQPIKPDFFYNKAENIMELMDNQIPVLEVSVKYQVNYAYPNIGIHYVKFSCTAGNSCVIDSNGKDKSISVSFPFKTKDDCYTFINLINDLKTVLTN